MEEKRTYRIETFDPLLRDLVAWGLVTRTDSTRPSWRLVEAAQRRIDQLAQRSQPLDVDQLLYLDHLCVDCRDRCRTRLYEGEYVCDSCMERRAVEAAAPVAPPAPDKGRSLWHRHRTTQEGHRPLAG
jgi:ribosomal protein L37AE/L43A